MVKTNLLRADPGETVLVAKRGTSATPEQAQADEKGIVRNDLGQAYSPGAYKIVERR